MKTRCTGFRPLGVALLLVLSPLLPGCATVIHGTRQDVRVETDPPGATASAGDQKITTPGVLKLKRKEKALEIVVEKAGYETRRVALTRKDSGWDWLNTIGIPVGIGTGGAIGHRSDSGFLAFEGAATGALIGGVVLSGAGFLIDNGNGAAYKLDPPLVVLRLEPVPTPASSPPTEGNNR
ncbi:MAG TPA: hypothetical protein VF554_02455 [Thermoanaerobaculia bacterium]